MKRTAPAPSLTLRDLSVADASDEQVVFVTNAVRRRGGLRTRAEHRRPVLAVVVD
ncbi:hypothetical protein [Nocardioides sp.]|uniref:hypothetical protein n=1 Tax=Nocardioides sp. TaxID=35761 RepID=UPI00272673D3|nr:hypothetical protein [Nocardioides sp.]MDO9455184.1 hypothetical protein [Nocardioides sp.]